MGIFNKPRRTWLRGMTEEKQTWSPWTVQKEHLVPRTKRPNPDSNEELAKRGALCTECPGGLKCCQYPE